MSKFAGIMASSKRDYFIYGTTSLLQKDKINEVVNILYFIVNWDGVKRSFSGKKHRRKDY
jgi:hypothetical protein